jgi:hypothetical protein
MPIEVFGLHCCSHTAHNAIMVMRWVGHVVRMEEMRISVKFYSEIWRKKDRLEEPKKDGEMECVWLRFGSNNELLWTR